jgi:hypothetical protein
MARDTLQINAVNKYFSESKTNIVKFINYYKFDHLNKINKSSPIITTIDKQAIEELEKTLRVLNDNYNSYTRNSGVVPKIFDPNNSNTKEIINLIRDLSSEPKYQINLNNILATYTDSTIYLNFLSTQVDKVNSRLKYLKNEEFNYENKLKYVAGQSLDIIVFMAVAKESMKYGYDQHVLDEYNGKKAMLKSLIINNQVWPSPKFWMYLQNNINNLAKAGAKTYAIQNEFNMIKTEFNK